MNASDSLMAEALHRVNMAMAYAYDKWCEGAGEEAVGKRRLGELLRQRGIAQQKAGKGLRKWKGVRLRSSEPENYAEQGELQEVGWVALFPIVSCISVS